MSRSTQSTGLSASKWHWKVTERGLGGLCGRLRDSAVQSPRSDDFILVGMARKSRLLRLGDVGARALRCAEQSKQFGVESLFSGPAGHFHSNPQCSGHGIAPRRMFVPKPLHDHWSCPCRCHRRWRPKAFACRADDPTGGSADREPASLAGRAPIVAVVSHGCVTRRCRQGAPQRRVSDGRSHHSFAQFASSTKGTGLFESSGCRNRNRPVSTLSVSGGAGHPQRQGRFSVDLFDRIFGALIGDPTYATSTASSQRSSAHSAAKRCTGLRSAFLTKSQHFNACDWAMIDVLHLHVRMNE